MSPVAIKICGLSTQDTVDAAIRSGASHIGLVFFPKSPRNVSIDQAAALASHARSRARVVGLFVDPATAFIDTVRKTVHLDAIQLHGSEQPAMVGSIRAGHGIEVWKAIGIRKSADLDAGRKYLGAADRLLYDAKPPGGAEVPGGTGLRIDWSLLAGYTHSMPWILAGGLDARNVTEAIGKTGAGFVDTSSGVESAPGVKDANRIAAFCSAVRSA